MKSLSPGNLYLSQVLKETINLEPVLIINGPGADPSSELRDLATMIVGNDKFTEVNRSLSINNKLNLFIYLFFCIDFDG